MTEPIKCANCGLDALNRKPLFMQPESGSGKLVRVAAELLNIKCLQDLIDVHRELGDWIIGEVKEEK